jgi:hypothetical protein
MAKVTLGAAISDLKGSVGGWTFQRNKSGLYVRSKPIGKSALSPIYQSLSKLPKTTGHEWHQLSASEQNEWNVYAAANNFTDKFGNVKTISGYNWFMAQNAVTDITGTSKITSPIPYSPPTDPPDFALTLSAANITISLAAPVTVANTWLILEITDVTQQTQVGNRGLFRFLGVLVYDLAISTQITSPWETKFQHSWNNATSNGSFWLHARWYSWNKLSGNISQLKFASAKWV